jgi:glutamate-ammonia-ligase adenylyltransferase
MALTRARVLAADRGFETDVAEAICNVVARPREARDVYPQVISMRELVAREKGEADPWDMKLATGGIMDLDFLAQALVLANGSTNASLVGLGTGEVIGEAGRLGILTVDAATQLGDAYRVLDDVAHWQRLTLGMIQTEPASPAMLKRLATLVGAPGPEELLARLGDLRENVRSVFRDVLGVPGAR